MKKIFYLFILITGISGAQEKEFTFNNERGMTDFIVTPIDGKTTPEIYKKVIEWIKVTFKNPSEVILSTIENEYVRFEGSSFLANSNAKYQIEVSIKEGRYKFDLISLQFYVTPTQYNIGGWTNSYINFNGNSSQKSRANMYKNDGSLRGWCKFVPDIPLYFNDLNKSLSESIKSSLKNNNDW